MAKEWPSAGELRLWRDRKEEAGKAREDWLRERTRNAELAANAGGEWARQSPVGGDQTGASTLMVRNTVGMNARQEVNRLMPKEPRWVARPMVGTVIEDGGVEIDNEGRASKLGAVTNIVAKGSGLVEELERCAYDGEVGCRGFMLVGFMGLGGDVSHGSGVPVDAEDGERRELSPASAKRAKRGGIVHGGVNPYFPYFVRLDPTTVYVDNEAKTDKEVNWIIREFIRPVESMKNEMINRIDWDTGKVVREHKYRMPDWIESNLVGGKWRAVKCYEAHYRCVAEEPEETKGGLEYWILTWVDERRGGTELTTPEAIRHERYAIDLGGFGIKMYASNLVNDDFWGYVPGIRDSIQASRYFNTSVSMDVDWNLRNKTRHVYNADVLDQQDVENLRKAEAEDWVPIHLKGDVPIQNVLGVIPANPIPEGLGRTHSLLSGLANEGSGRSENQRGQTSNVRTASEAQIVAQETSAQVAAKQKRFRRFAEECIRAGMIIFTFMLPEEGPRKNGGWQIPDPDQPGKYVDFTKRDLGAQAEIEYDLLSQVLKDDTVVVAQGLQLLDVTAKVLQAPPDVQRKVMPLLERVLTAMGPDWEAKAGQMFRVDETLPHPHMEHMLMLDGNPVEPEQAEDLMMHIDLHRAMMKNGPREMPDLWMRPLGTMLDPQSGTEVEMTPLAILQQHLADTEELAQQKGLKVRGSSGGMRGSGPGSGRAPQAAPNAGEIAAGAENAMMPNTMGVRGMQEAM